jgi:hypothetical protein
LDCHGWRLTTFVSLVESALSLGWLLVYFFITDIYHSSFAFFNVAWACHLFVYILDIDFYFYSTGDGNHLILLDTLFYPRDWLCDWIEPKSNAIFNGVIFITRPTCRVIRDEMVFVVFI